MKKCKNMNLINGEALEQLKLIPNKSIDFVRWQKLI